MSTASMSEVHVCVHMSVCFHSAWYAFGRVTLHPVCMFQWVPCVRCVFFTIPFFSNSRSWPSSSSFFSYRSYLFHSIRVVHVCVVLLHFYHLCTHVFCITFVLLPLTCVFFSLIFTSSLLPFAFLLAPLSLPSHFAPCLSIMIIRCFLLFPRLRAFLAARISNGSILHTSTCVCARATVCVCVHVLNVVVIAAADAAVAAAKYLRPEF